MWCEAALSKLPNFSVNVTLKANDHLKKMDSNMLLNSTENECSILHFIHPSRVINVSPHIQSCDFILYLLSERI